MVVPLDLSLVELKTGLSLSCPKPLLVTATVIYHNDCSRPRLVTPNTSDQEDREAVHGEGEVKAGPVDGVN